MLQAPALPCAQISQKVVDSKQRSRDAPPASAATSPKQREGRKFQAEFLGGSTRQRGHLPKTRESRKFQTEFSGGSARERGHPRARESSIPNRTLRTLYAPARPPAQNNERVVDAKQNSINAPRQSCHSPKTGRGSSIPKRIVKTLDVPALPPAENSEGVVQVKFSGRSAIRRKQREPRGFQTEFARRSTRLHCHRRKQREGHRVQAEFAGRSARQRCHPPKTARGHRGR